MVRYIIEFEYLGKDFFGSQTQKDKRTVQTELKKAISTLTKQKSTTVILAGRTDRGVSAKNQTAHFDTSDDINVYRFLNSLNSILPSDISVLCIKKAKAEFHAQKSATYRHYRYVINNSNRKSVFDLNVHQYRLKLNETRMNTAIKFLEGVYDFSAFKSVSDNPATVCNIHNASVIRKGNYIIIDIIGDRFLYNMVRAITGTLLMIEKNNLNPLEMKNILDSKERCNAGPNVSPIGLTLIKTGYDDPYKYIENTIQKGK